ncbi:MAG TPA: hypothetical protein VGM39_25600 [Kofleriaceae bacterium]|jgi:hypothetical protein
MKRSLGTVIALACAVALAQPGAGAPAHADVAAPPPAAPTKITSIEAKPLINALRLAAVKSSKVETKTTWTIKTLSCATEGGDEVISPRAVATARSSARTRRARTR